VHTNVTKTRGSSLPLLVSKGMRPLHGAADEQKVLKLRAPGR
jgi:hypothetical protein